MDLTNYTIQELKDLQENIANEINRRKQSEKKRVIKELAALAKAKGYSLDELIGKTSIQKTQSAGKVKPKYCNPADSTQTWTGRGRKPAWVVDYLSKGKTLADIII